MQGTDYGPPDLDRAVAGVGWASYVDSTYTAGSPLSLNVGNGFTTPLTNDGLTSKIVSQWPAGVTEPWNTSTGKLVGINDGDVFDLRVGLKAQNGAAAELLDIYIDIGGAQGVILQESKSIAKGASTETDVTFEHQYFTGSTFLLNGGTIYLSTADSNTDMDIWDISLFVFRKFVGR